MKGKITGMVIAFLICFTMVWSVSAQATITVTADTSMNQLGSQNRPPSHIGDFIMNQNAPLQINGWEPWWWRDHKDYFTINAWKDIGMVAGDVRLFHLDPNDPNIPEWAVDWGD